jgi:hypothetical protein
MLAEIEAFSVDEAKMQQMTQHCWCTLEQPIIACSIEFRHSVKESWTNGHILFTRGAVYIFKNKMFSSVELVRKFHLLSIERLEVRPPRVHFSADTFQLFLKTDNVISIAHAMDYIIQEAIFGLPHVKTMEIDSIPPLPEVQIKQRPQFALRWRALFLAHFYGIAGEQLYTVDYFDKWEYSPSSTLNLGATFHPGNFGAAFGHAIAWEAMLTTVCFQHFSPTQFGRLMTCLVQNAVRIKTLIFCDYRPGKLP